MYVLGRPKEPRRIGARGVVSIQVAGASPARCATLPPFSLANRGSSCLLFSSSFRPVFIPFLPAHRCNLWTASGRRRDREDREGRPDKSLVVKRAEIAAAPELRGGVRSLDWRGLESRTIFDADRTVSFLFVTPKERESFSLGYGGKVVFGGGSRWFFAMTGIFIRRGWNLRSEARRSLRLESWQVRLVLSLKRRGEAELDLRASWMNSEFRLALTEMWILRNFSFLFLASLDPPLSLSLSLSAILYSIHFQCFLSPIFSDCFMPLLFTDFVGSLQRKLLMFLRFFPRLRKKYLISNQISREERFNANRILWITLHVVRVRGAKILDDIPRRTIHYHRSERF